MRAQTLFSLCILFIGCCLFQPLKVDASSGATELIRRASLHPNGSMLLSGPVVSTSVPSSMSKTVGSIDPSQISQMTTTKPDSSRILGSGQPFTGYPGRDHRDVNEPTPKTCCSKPAVTARTSLDAVDEQLAACKAVWNYSSCVNPNLIDPARGVFVPSHRISPFLLRGMWKNVNASMSYFESMKFYDAAWEDSWYVSYFNNQRQPHISHERTKLNIPLLVIFMLLVKFVSSFYVARLPKDEPILMYSRLEKINPLGHFSKRLIGVFWRQFEEILPTSLDEILRNAVPDGVEEFIRTQDICRYIFILVFKRVLKSLFMNKRAMIDRFALMRKIHGDQDRAPLKKNTKHYKGVVQFVANSNGGGGGVERYPYIARTDRITNRGDIVIRMTCMNIWYVVKYFVLPLLITMAAIFIQHQLYQTGFSYSLSNIHHFKAKEYFESVIPSGAYPFSFLSLKILNPLYRLVWYHDYVAPQIKAIFMLLGIRLFCNWFKATIDSFDVKNITFRGKRSRWAHVGSFILILGWIPTFLGMIVPTGLKLLIGSNIEWPAITWYNLQWAIALCAATVAYYWYFGTLFDWTHVIASHYIIFMAYFIWGYCGNTFSNYYEPLMSKLFHEFEWQQDWPKLCVPTLVVVSFVASMRITDDRIYQFSVLQALAWTVWYYSIGDVYETTQFMMSRWRTYFARADYAPDSYAYAALSTIAESTSYFAVNFGINMVKDNSDRFDYYSYTLRPFNVTEDLAKETIASNSANGTIPLQYLDASSRVIPPLVSFAGQLNNKTRQRVKDGLFDLARVPSDLQIDARFANFLFRCIQGNDWLRVLFENQWVVPFIFFVMFLVHTYYENLKETALAFVVEKTPEYSGPSAMNKGDGPVQGKAPKQRPMERAFAYFASLVGRYPASQPLTLSILGYLAQNILLQASLYYTDKDLTALANKYLTSMYGVRRYYSSLISNLIVEKLNLLSKLLGKASTIGDHFLNSANIVILTRFIGNLIDALPFKLVPMAILLLAVLVVNAALVEWAKRMANAPHPVKGLRAKLKGPCVARATIVVCFVAIVLLTAGCDEGFRTIINAVMNVDPGVAGRAAMLFVAIGLCSGFFLGAMPDEDMKGLARRELTEEEKSPAFRLLDNSVFKLWYWFRTKLLRMAPEKGYYKLEELKALARLRFYYVALPTMAAIYWANCASINRIIFAAWHWFSQDIRFYVALTLIVNRNAILPTHFGNCLFNREFPVPLVFDSLSLLVLRVVDDITLTYQIDASPSPSPSTPTTTA